MIGTTLTERDRNKKEIAGTTQKTCTRKDANINIEEIDLGREK